MGLKEVVGRFRENSQAFSPSTVVLTSRKGFTDLQFSYFEGEEFFSSRKTPPAVAAAMPAATGKIARDTRAATDETNDATGLPPQMRGEA